MDRPHPRLCTPIRTALLAFALALAAGSARSQKPPDITSGEMALIPAYCPHTMGFEYGDQYTNTSPQAGRWVATMGRGFWAVHHYCWGLIKERRALLPGQRKEIREGLLKSVVGEYQYVIRNSPADFVLLPELFVKLGDTYRRLDDYANALAAFETARVKKPDYWPACTRWAELLADVGRKPEARTYLEGCMRVMDSPQLRALYSRLGGNPNWRPPAAAASSASSP